MTMRGFGEVMPIHIFMLQLAGYVVDDRGKRIRAAVSEEERQRTMREGLEELCDWTEEDFGYDLAAWREYLLEDEESGYTHSYAFNNVDPAILEAIADRQRQATADQLRREEAEGEDEGEESWGMSGPDLFPSQLFMLDLAGLVITRRCQFQPAKNEHKRKRLMRRGRRELRKWTDQDFGYDLTAWHEYLLAHDEGYAHPYAREGFEQCILEAVGDEVRQRLAAELAQEDSRN
jgi:hypothetical protein